MDKSDFTPEAMAVAQEVDLLFCQGDNNLFFTEHIETFKRESRERLVAEKKAKEDKQRALDAVWGEQRGVKAGKVKPRLTDPTASPGAGHVWFRGSYPAPTEHGRRRSCGVCGWIPSSVAKAIEEEHRGTVSLAAMFAYLAALHDLCLPARTRILPEPLDDWDKGLRSPDLGVRALMAFSVWVVRAAKNEGNEGRERCHTLCEYLSGVRRHLAKQIGRGGPEAASGRALPKYVQPIHFEDYNSGKQFERLVFAYHVRSDEWLSLEWFGQTGKDKGRDIMGVRKVDGRKNGESICILCANWKKLTWAKVKGDIDKVLKSPSGKPQVIRVICGHDISATLRDKARKYARSAGIRACELWSGQEFEERLRASAEPIFRRFVNGAEFPDTPGEIRKFASIDEAAGHQ
jgi:hypothetical protein